MAVIRTTTVLVATLILSVVISSSSGNSPFAISESDQYKEGEVKHQGSHPPRPLDEATDHRFAFRIPHRFHKKPLVETKKHEVVEIIKRPIPEVQLESGGGLLKTESVNKGGFQGRRQQVKQRRKRSTSTREKRGFYPYTAQVIQAPPIQPYTYFDPSAYQIQRPYVIPVWGTANRYSIYFPPQPIYSNPGFPPNNPPLPSRTYLPVPPTTAVPTDDRFYFPDDDLPKWGNGNSINPTERPSTGQQPTRRPGVTSSTTFPPLVHKVNDTAGNSMSAGGSASTTTRRPATQPPFIHRPTTTSSPPPNVPQGLSQCIWATVSCCSGITSEVSYSCFEQLGCVGAFWDTSPCDSAFAKAAIQAALNYYN